MNSALGEFQTTLARPVAFEGIGVHRGTNVSIAFHPAEPDSGIVFRTLSADGGYRDIRAVSANVVSTDLCTIIGQPGGATVATVEHLMAAMRAMGIDNLRIDIDGAEVPIMDGSSAPFVDAIDRAGIAEQASHRRYIRIRKPVRVETGGSWGEFTPYDGMRFEIDIDFDTPVIGRQAWKGDLDGPVFRNELARSRTFGFMRDVERLWASGFALGASLENAIVIGDDERVINPEGLRFANEFARHKALDAVGDLALAGAPFIGCFRSYRGGHKLNALALKALLEDADAYELAETSSRGAGRRNPARLVAVNAPAFAPWTV